MSFFLCLTICLCFYYNSKIVSSLFALLCPPPPTPQHTHLHTINPHGECQDSPITTPPLAKPKQTLSLSKCGLIAFNIHRPCKTLGRRTVVPKVGGEWLPLTVHHSVPYKRVQVSVVCMKCCVKKIPQRHHSLKTLQIFLPNV